MALADINESELLSALSKSDEEAFARIYNGYWKVLYQTAMQRVHDEDQAKDIVQDVFVKLWDQREKLEICHLKAYLQTAVRNQIFNLVARKKVNEHYFKYISGFSNVQASADESLRCDELFDHFKLALDRMPEKRKEIFQLRFEQEMSTKHIADKLNITQKTVQNQLIKAVHYLKTYLSFYFLFFADFLFLFIFLFK